MYHPVPIQDFCHMKAAPEHKMSEAKKRKMKEAFLKAAPNSLYARHEERYLSCQKNPRMQYLYIILYIYMDFFLFVCVCVNFNLSKLRLETDCLKIISRLTSSLESSKSTPPVHNNIDACLQLIFNRKFQTSKEPVNLEPHLLKYYSQNVQVSLNYIFLLIALYEQENITILKFSVCVIVSPLYNKG